MNKKALFIIIIILALGLAGGAYFYFFFNSQAEKGASATQTEGPAGFSPFGSSGAKEQTNGASTTSESTSTDQQSSELVGSLRLLSNTPVGGYGASTTASSTIVRWIERGRGNVLEVNGSLSGQATLSNTLVPRMYESLWNKNLTAFIGSILPENAIRPTTVYSSLKKTVISSTTDTTTVTPYELKGKTITSDVLAYAVSPAGDKVFLFIKESDRGVGYTANFDGTNMVRVFDTPLTAVNVEWPEANTIAITTKGIASQSGYLYFINAKTGVMTRILGPIYGLSTKTSRDAKHVLASSVGKTGGVETAIYAVASSSASDAVVKTLADKCVWGNFYKNMAYCAVPVTPPQGTLPDDWYKGSISFADRIWQLNVTTGEVKLVSSIVDQSDRVIDAYNLGIDAKDDFLFFMNKNDLSLWSLDLVKNN